MENELYFNAVIGLCFVVGLIFLCAFIARKYGINANIGGTNHIKIIASKNIDIKNKIVLFQTEDSEYLILLSQNNTEVLNKKYLKGNNPPHHHRNNNYNKRKPA